MAVKKKPRPVAPRELTTQEVGEELLKRLPVVRRESSAKCDVSSHDLVSVMIDSVTASLESIYPGVPHIEHRADAIARDVLRHLRYGTPTPSETKPVPIRDADISPPLCKECKA